MIIRAYWNGKVGEIEYDASMGFETLKFQLISLFGLEISSLILVDFLGREIGSHDDLEDVKVVEVLEIASLTDGNSSLDEWSQHVDFEGSPGDTTVLSSAPLVSTNVVVSMWCIVESLTTSNEFCSRYCLGENEQFIQPMYKLVDTPFRLCSSCKNLFDPSMIVVGQTSHLQLFCCESDKAIDFGLAFSDAQISLEIGRSLVSAYGTMSSFSVGPTGMFLRRMFLKRSIAFQPISNTNRSPQEQAFYSRLNSGCKTVRVYEDPAQQAAARACIDYLQIRQYAQLHMDESMEKAGKLINDDIAFLQGLLHWFKCDFFKWCNKPECSNPTCRAKPMHMGAIGVSEPSEEERGVGWAGRTELYRCDKCQQVTRFARFNNPAHLLKTRRGRCGEWANAFCLVCRALSLDVRWVLDFTDHVWAEVWVPSLGRYVHADPCERKLDAPLMYETGWNKKLTYVLSFSRHGVVDATPKYSRKLPEVLQRRGASEEGVSERVLQEALARFDESSEQQHLTERNRSPVTVPVTVTVPRPVGPSPSTDLGADSSVAALQSAFQGSSFTGHTSGGGGSDMGSSSGGDSSGLSLLQSSTSASGGSIDEFPPRPSPSVVNLESLVIGIAAFESLAETDISVLTMRRRKRLLAKELWAMTLMSEQEFKLEELQGRISGDTGWKLSRGEMGRGAGEGDSDTATVGGSDGGDGKCSSGDKIVSASSYAFKYPQRENSVTSSNVDCTSTPGLPWLVPGLVFASSAATPVGGGSGGFVDVTVRSNGYGDTDAMLVPMPTIADSRDDGSPARHVITVGGVSLAGGFRGCNVVALSRESGSLVASVTTHTLFASTARALAMGDGKEVDKVVTEEHEKCSVKGSEGGLASDSSLTSDGATDRFNASHFEECVILSSVLECVGESLPHTSSAAAGGFSVDSCTSISPSATFNSLSGKGPTMLKARIGCLSASCAHELVLVNVDTSGDLDLCCAVPSSIVSPASIAAASVSAPSSSSSSTSSEVIVTTAAAIVVEHAKALCCSDARSLGLVYCKKGNHALLFGDAGYPLFRTRQSGHMSVHLKTEANCAYRGKAMVDELAGRSLEGTGGLVEGGDAADGKDAGVCSSIPAYADTDLPPPPSATINGAIASTKVGGGGESAPAGVSVSSTVSQAGNTGDSCQVLLQYVHLGGGRHGDTVPFDATQFLWALLDQLGQHETLPSGGTCGSSEATTQSSVLELWRNLHVDEIILWAGASLVNGVQCFYSVNPPQATADTSSQPAPMAFPSPSFTSSNDDPSLSSLQLDPQDPGDIISSITVGRGDLVDSVELTCANGRSVRVGGTGGSLCTFHIPAGWRFCGFYGGTGGHLHNLGVVLLREEPPLSSLPASSSSDSSHIQASPAITAAESTTVQPLSSAVATAATSESGTSAVATAATSESSTSVDKRGGIGHEVCVSDFGLAGRLYKLCVTNDLVACGMLNFYQPSECHRRQADIGVLIGLCAKVVTANSPQAARVCTDTCAAYLENIVKKPSDLKLRKVRIGNAFFAKTILAATGGLELFCFGPGGFRLSPCGSGPGPSPGSSSSSGGPADACTCCFESCVKLISEGGEVSQSDWLRWLRSYAAFLRGLNSVHP